MIHTNNPIKNEQARYSNWQLAADGDQILWLYFDKAGSSANSFDKTSLSELEEIIESLMGETGYKGLVIASKKSGFIAGADIKEFTQFQSTNDAFDFVRSAQLIFDKIEHLKMPTVAMVNGHCLGGGFELALACQYRVAIETDKKILGFPEVLIGIHPAWGGTVRATRLIGLAKSLPLMLRGNSLRPMQALKLGLVDVVQPERHLASAARACVLGKVKIKRKHSHISNLRLMKSIIAHKAKKALRQKNILPSHYPAPYAMIDFLKTTNVNTQAAYLAEAHSIARLVETDSTKQLVRCFFLQDQLKKLAKGAGDKVTHVHVVGAGTMGGDIAAWCAAKGMMVTLQDREPKFIAPAIKRAYKGYQKALRDPKRIRDVMDRLIPDQEGRGVVSADIIIEAIFENLEAKQDLFKLVESKAKPNAILATNTSSIPLEEIASALTNPGRLIGVHFFNPVAKMMLIEVISHSANSDALKQRVLKFVGQLGKLPVPMKSGPGFLVNRILMPYLMQAMKLYEEGIAPTVIDKVAMDFGMPMGPVTLADVVGLDVCLHVVSTVGEVLGLRAPEKLKKLVEAGKLGVKTGQGLYKYKNGKVQKPHTPHKVDNQDVLTDRLILVMLNEAVACLREGIVDEADFVDAGMIFGTGFAPFRGGPIQYAKKRGVPEILKRMRTLNAEYGDAINIDPGWESL